MSRINIIYLILPLMIFLQYSCSKDNDMENQIPEIEGKIAFRNSTVKGINVLQTGEIRLIRGEYENDLYQSTGGYYGISGMKWSPDGTKIAYLVRNSFLDGIRIMNSDGSQYSELMNISCFSCAGFDWSPDGSQILVSNTNSKKGTLLNLDGSIDSTTTVLINSTKSHFDWSPDGEKILFLGGRIDQDSVFHFGIFVANLDGSQLSQLSSSLLDTRPTWSPDGLKITFDRRESLLGDTGDVYIMNSDGTNKYILDKGTFPIWSPNGNKIAYKKDNSVFIIDIDGSNSFNVPIGQPDWMDWN